MAPWPGLHGIFLSCTLLVVIAEAGLTLNFNNTEHVLYEDVSSNYYGTTPEVPAPLVAPVHIVTPEDFELIEELACDNEDQTNASFLFQGLILVVPITWREQYYAHCGVPYKEGERRIELAKLDWICSQGVLAIVVEKQFFQQTSVPAIQDWHKPLDVYPNLRACDTYRVAVRESIALPFTGRSNMTGKLSWDPDPFLSFFQQDAVLYVCRPILAVGYFVVAALAAKHLWQRYRRDYLNVVFAFLLVSAFVTMTILSIATAFGTFLVWGWQSDFHASFQLSVYTQFLGTSIAGDYFTAILYTQLASSLRSGVRIQNTGVHRQYPILFTIGVVICLCDAIYFVLVLIGIPLSLLAFLIPAGMVTLEIVVLIFTVRQTLKTAHHLKQSRITIEVTLKANEKSNKAQIRLERRIRFWVKVTVMSSLGIMAALGLFATRIMLRTPQLFLVNMALASFGKIGNVLAQVMVAAPPPSSVSRVALIPTSKASSLKQDIISS